MALYDNRVFKAGDKWWVAEVHGASGTGFSDPPRIMHETVIFTCLSDDTLKSLSASLPARRLRTMSHLSLVDVLNNATPFTDTRLPLRPTNAPDADELSSEHVVVDANGLRWVLRKTTQLRIEPNGVVEGAALEVICLDDSAMRREVALESSAYDEDEIVERVSLLFLPHYVTPMARPTTRYYRWKRVGVPNPPPMKMW